MYKITYNKSYNLKLWTFLQSILINEQSVSHSTFKEEGFDKKTGFYYMERYGEIVGDDKVYLISTNEIYLLYN